MFKPSFDRQYIHINYEKTGNFSHLVAMHKLERNKLVTRALQLLNSYKRSVPVFAVIDYFLCNSHLSISHWPWQSKKICHGPGNAFLLSLYCNYASQLCAAQTISSVKKL
jgi:hypothetical protein